MPPAAKGPTDSSTCDATRVVSQAEDLTEKRTSRINVRTTPSIRDAIAAAAAVAGLPESALIEQIVRQKLESDGFGLWVPLSPDTAARLMAVAARAGEPAGRVAGRLIADALDTTAVVHSDAATERSGD